MFEDLIIEILATPEPVITIPASSETVPLTPDELAAHNKDLGELLP